MLPVIGVDFDNTLIDYNNLFYEAALAHGLINSGFQLQKTAVRNFIRQQPEGEEKWQYLQAQVYGSEILKAPLFAGAGDFLTICREKSFKIFIISHKSSYAVQAPDGPNLRQKALQWMEKQGFFDQDRFALAREDVFFESTRQEKLACISRMSCTHFIDDLVEIFQEKSFPPNVLKILFNPGAGNERNIADIVSCPSWKDIIRHLFALP